MNDSAAEYSFVTDCLSLYLRFILLSLSILFWFVFELFVLFNLLSLFESFLFCSSSFRIPLQCSILHLIPAARNAIHSKLTHTLSIYTLLSIIHAQIYLHPNCCKCLHIWESIWCAINCHGANVWYTHFQFEREKKKREYFPLAEQRKEKRRIKKKQHKVCRFHLSLRDPSVWNVYTKKKLS